MVMVTSSSHEFTLMVCFPQFHCIMVTVFALSAKMFHPIYELFSDESVAVKFGLWLRCSTWWVQLAASWSGLLSTVQISATNSFQLQLKEQ